MIPAQQTNPLATTHLETMGQYLSLSTINRFPKLLIVGIGLQHTP
jgi:hypothetical protein